MSKGHSTPSSRLPFSAPGEPSILDMTTPRDNLRWALSALDLLSNGLRNSHKLKADSVEMVNLTAARASVEEALRLIRARPPEDADRFSFIEEKAATIYCGLSGHWVFVDEKAKTRTGVIGLSLRGCIDAAMKEGTK